MSVTSCGLGRETSTLSEAGYECLLPRESQESPRPTTCSLSKPWANTCPACCLAPSGRASHRPLSDWACLEPRSHLLAPQHPSPRRRVGPCKSWPTLSPRLWGRGVGGRPGKAGLSWPLQMAPLQKQKLPTAGRGGRGGHLWKKEGDGGREEKSYGGRGGGYVISGSSLLPNKLTLPPLKLRG